MGISISIKKIASKNNSHFYAVYNYTIKTDQIAYFMELDSKTKKILFYSDKNCTDPDIIFNTQENKYEKNNNVLTNLINLRVVSKGLQALKNDFFPDDISWHS